MLHDENEELRDENDQLINKIDTIAFQFEAQMEKLNIEKKDFQKQIEFKGKFIEWNLWIIDKQLKDSNERNKNLEDKVRDLKRQITILTLEGKEVS